MTVERLDWDLPSRVSAYTTTRTGGAGQGAYAAFNLAQHVGDEAAAVDANRDILASQLPRGCRLHWLQQLHGTEVVVATHGASLEADASITSTPGDVCIVQTADCLPLLLCAADGSAVAAVHAGWRGLLNGVVENAVAAFNTATPTLRAWLGPSIGPDHFEVGAEVREAFCAAAVDADLAATEACFSPSPRGQGRSLADLHGLALVRLRRLGVTDWQRDPRCTYRERDAFFSYRRSGNTGRMASLILINP